MRPHPSSSTSSKQNEENKFSQRSESIKKGNDINSEIARAGGIVRIRVSTNKETLKSMDHHQSTDEQKDRDDDTDSAISLENVDQVLFCNTLRNGQESHGYSKLDEESISDDEDETTLSFYQRPNSGSKRSSMQNTKMKMARPAKGDGKMQLNASGGHTVMPTWKLRKAMKSFKSAKMGNGREGDVGAPHIQYFLASLCDHSISSTLITETTTSCDFSMRQYEDNNSFTCGLRARCPLAIEVKELVSKLRSSQPVNAQSFQLSVAVTVLKEFLGGIPGGVFGELTEEFYQISIDSSLQLTIMYLHSIIHEMPYVIQQFTYLLCKALRNLIRLTGGNSLKNYTDLLMHFTPVLFSSSVGDIEKFLRAARLLLVMVDDCHRVFFPLPWLDVNGHWCWHNGDFEDETFFRQIFDSLQNLEARLATDDSGVESEADESFLAVPPFNHDQSPGRRTLSTCSLVDFYQVVYLDDNAETETLD